jgi:hypothetical protein
MIFALIVEAKEPHGHPKNMVFLFVFNVLVFIGVSDIKLQELSLLD